MTETHEGVVLVDSTSVSRDFPSAVAHGRWTEQAHDHADRLRRMFRWDDRIRAVIVYRGIMLMHVLNLSIKARGRLFGISLSLDSWAVTDYHPGYVAAAFNRLVRQAFFEARS